MEYKNNILLFPQNRVWRTYPGGKVLDQLAGKASPEDSHFPEDWIGSTTQAINPGREDIVEGLANAIVNGETICFKDLLDKDPEYFLGKDHVEKFGTQVMVLVKFLDSAVRLHFQCHPTAEFAQKHLNSPSGKAEAYYILSAREGVDPYVYLGFQRPPEKEVFKKMIEDQDLEAIEKCFDKIKVKPGDVLFIPGGFPHAIGEGVFMIEIMEPSDWAVRFEFEKGGYVLPKEARFLNRGIDFALNVFDYTQISEEEVRKNYMFKPQKIRDLGENSAQYELINNDVTPCYTIRQTKVKGNASKKESSAYIGIVAEGNCIIETPAGKTELKQFDKFFYPYGLGSINIESADGVTIVEAFPPTEKRSF